jgi:hypothetical protein
MSSLADQAASNAGVVLSDYSRKIYAFPQTGCGWWGLGTVGGNPSRSWVNGSLQVRVVAHELGHGLGLYHSNSLDCGTTTLGTDCGAIEYGDVVDTMGGPIGFTPAAHYNAFQKERLGWLNSGLSPPIMTVTSSGTYTLGTYESLDPGPKALKILKSIDPSSGQKTWYYIEFRQPLGFDGFLASNSYVASYTNIPNGVILHTGSEWNGNSSYMLDLMPQTDTWWDPALAVGQIFADPNAGITLTPNWVGATGASVTVNLGSGITGTATTIAVSTDKASYTRNQTVSITASVGSGGSPVAKASVNFIVKKPNGTLVTANVVTGNNGNAVYKLRLTKTDPVGS